MRHENWMARGISCHFSLGGLSVELLEHHANSSEEFGSHIIISNLRRYDLVDSGYSTGCCFCVWKKTATAVVLDHLPARLAPALTAFPVLFKFSASGHSSSWCIFLWGAHVCHASAHSIPVPAAVFRCHIFVRGYHVFPLCLVCWIPIKRQQVQRAAIQMLNTCQSTMIQRSSNWTSKT